MNTPRNLTCFLTFLLLSVIGLPGCSSYYESQAKDMVERQMDAMVFVEGGEFMMGNPGGWSVRSDTVPVHRVVLDEFYIQKYEVTQGDFELFMEVTGYEPSSRFYDKWRDEKPKRYHSDLPAVASWKDAVTYCNWLGEKANEPTQLPTEAQWEYAARARGKALRYATKDGEAIENETMAPRRVRARFDESPVGSLVPHPPGKFPPNPIGLYDMSGNAAEWVQDYYQKDYYEYSQTHNPLGPKTPDASSPPGNPYRVLRGGNFKDFVGNTTVTRRKEIQNGAGETTGFRCGY